MATGGVLSQRDRPEWPQFTFDEIKAIVQEAEKVGTYVAAHAHGDLGGLGWPLRLVLGLLNTAHY